MIRVVLADDQPLVRAGFAMILDAEDDMCVVGQADDGVAAVEQARSTAPDVLLMDVRMPRMDGLEATNRIVADPSLSGVRILILTTFELDEYVFDALPAGPAGSWSSTPNRRSWCARYGRSPLERRCSHHR